MYIGYSLRGTKSCNKKEKRKKKKTEDIDKHFKKFERLANIRGWSERNKLEEYNKYLKGAVYKFLFETF